MTKYATQTFFVTPTGVGRIDYTDATITVERITNQTVEQVLKLTYPEQSAPANSLDDFAQISLGATPVEYVVGTNANLQRADSWTLTVLAKRVSFFSDADFFVRFNYADAIEHEVPAKILKTFDKRTERIFVRAKDRSGTLRVWIEG